MRIVTYGYGHGEGDGNETVMVMVLQWATLKSHPTTSGRVWTYWNRFKKPRNRNNSSLLKVVF